MRAGPLEHCHCTLPIHTNHPLSPPLQVPQPPDKASVARDALAKALYGSLFDWMLARINEKMNPGGAGGTDTRRTIGLLDIFGFEVRAKEGGRGRGRE